jgi:hypothetical protein
LDRDADRRLPGSRLRAWLEAPSPGGRDRTWHLLSQALTCAQELRLDQPLPEGVIQQYRSLLNDAGLSADLLESNKRRVQQILFSLELTYVSVWPSLLLSSG